MILLPINCVLAMIWISMTLNLLTKLYKDILYLSQYSRNTYFIYLRIIVIQTYQVQVITKFWKKRRKWRFLALNVKRNSLQNQAFRLLSADTSFTKNALRDGLDETENALNVRSTVHKDKYTEFTPNNQKICLNQVNKI